MIDEGPPGGWETDTETHDPGYDDLEERILNGSLSDPWVERQAQEARATAFPELAAEATSTNGTTPAGDAEPLTPEARLRRALLVGEAICDIPPPEPLMGGVLNRDSLALLFGAPGGGKSLLALDWGMHIATGSYWQGEEIEPGNVLYVLAEGVRGTGPRVRAWKDVNRYTDRVPDGFVWLPTPVDLREPSWTGPLALVAADLSPSLIVIDTLNRCAPGTDEGPADMGKIIAAADLLRRMTGACVLIVHHSGKDQTQGARGHSSLLGAVDTELELKNGGDGILVLKMTKQKDGADGRMWRLKLVAGSESVAVAAYDGRVADEERTLTQNGVDTLDALSQIATVRGVPTGQWREAAEDAGVSKTQFYVQVKRLEQLGVVTDISSSSRPMWVPTEFMDD